MGNQSAFEAATLDMLRYLKEKKRVMQVRHLQELAEVDREIDAVSITVRLLREAGKNPEPAQEIKTLIPKDLHGKSARAACIEIAKLNSGIVRVSDARDALIAAGILSKKKNAWGIVYTTLTRADEFEKATPGSFRFVPEGKPQEQRLLQ
jgi:hypothetical protein